MWGEYVGVLYSLYSFWCPLFILSTVLAHLMLLAFLIDQIQQMSCPLFQAALKKCWATKIVLWGRVRHLFLMAKVPDWETFYRCIAQEIQLQLVPPDTS